MKPRYIECGCCESYHRADYFGDCRNNAERFNAEDLDAKHGATGWDIVPNDDEETAQEVSNGDTRLGFGEWLNHKAEDKLNDEL